MCFTLLSAWFGFQAHSLQRHPELSVRSACLLHGSLSALKPEASQTLCLAVMDASCFIIVCTRKGSRVKRQSSQHSTLRYRFGPYFVSPVIAGLDEKTSEPFICGMDTIGAIETAKDFMVAGTAPDSLYGMCESMWQPDMVSIRKRK